MFKDVDEGFAWIESYTNLEKKTDQIKRHYRLDRMVRLLEACGNPQKSFRTIHLAGSKGKGSTAVLIAAGLEAAGHKTGLYTSPHLLCYQERIRINRALLDDRIYLAQIRRLRELVTGPSLALPGGDEPTTFELLTLLGFLIFREEGCRWAVVETGLGGRLDATNTVEPAVTVITPIEKEHTAWLGNTLEEIAREKAGIIKAGVPVIAARQRPEVRKVLEETARRRGAPFFPQPEDAAPRELRISREGSAGRIEWKPGREDFFRLAMIGSIQLENAAAALAALEQAEPERQIAAWLEGFQRAELPGRMQILSADPLTVVDGAHTPASLKLAIQGFQALREGAPSDEVLLFACGDDKNAREMAALGVASFARIYVTTPGFFKKSHPRRVAEAFRLHCSEVTLIEDPAEALGRIRRDHPASPLLAAGSFFLAGEIIRLHREHHHDKKEGHNR